MKKALYFEILHYDPSNIELLSKNYEVLTLRDPSLVDKEILKDVTAVFAPLGYYFGAEFIDLAPKLEIIATNTTGVPHIDVDYASKRGISVISLKGERAFLRKITPTAEFTFGLMLALIRKIPPAFNSVLEGNWNRWEFGGPKMISSMSLGIVGLGRLGTMIARYASCFGMDTAYYDPYISPRRRSKATRVNSIAELVSTRDIITVHIPLEEKNRNFFNRERFSCFKSNSYFINTSRGEVVDSMALLESLESGKIAGAALDVLDGEFEPSFPGKVSNHPLVEYAGSHDNLIITPHIAGSTRDAWFKTQRFIIEKAIGRIKTS